MKKDILKKKFLYKKNLLNIFITFIDFFQVKIIFLRENLLTKLEIRHELNKFET